jgi:hypothetical protein
MLVSVFSMIPDHRRAQARRYDLPHFLLICVLGILSGAHSYRHLETFMRERFGLLRETFPALQKWKRPPSDSAIRKILHETDADELEKAFRRYSHGLPEKKHAHRFLGIDGKVLRGSFDHFEDQVPVQLLSVFATGSDIILAHEEIQEQKTNEIPVAQALIPALGLQGAVFTLDALHCQKKRSRQPGRQGVMSSSR